jgi:hypothetical protein
MHIACCNLIAGIFFAKKYPLITVLNDRRKCFVLQGLCVNLKPKCVLKVKLKLGWCVSGCISG